NQDVAKGASRRGQGLCNALTGRSRVVRQRRDTGLVDLNALATAIVTPSKRPEGAWGLRSFTRLAPKVVTHYGPLFDRHGTARSGRHRDPDESSSRSELSRAGEVLSNLNCLWKTANPGRRRGPRLLADVGQGVLLALVRNHHRDPKTDQQHGQPRPLGLCQRKPRDTRGRAWFGRQPVPALFGMLGRRAPR